MHRAYHPHHRFFSINLTETMILLPSKMDIKSRGFRQNLLKRNPKTDLKTLKFRFQFGKEPFWLAVKTFSKKGKSFWRDEIVSALPRASFFHFRRASHYSNSLLGK